MVEIKIVFTFIPEPPWSLPCTQSFLKTLKRDAGGCGMNALNIANGAANCTSIWAGAGSYILTSGNGHAITRTGNGWWKLEVVIQSHGIMFVLTTRTA